MSFWVCSIGRVSQTCLSVFFHMTIVLFFPLFFLDAQRQVETPQNYLQIVLQLVDNHGFKVGTHSLRDPDSSKARLKTGYFYPWILATTGIYLHSIFFHERDHHFAMEFGVHDEKLQTIVFAARKNLSLKTCNIMGQSMFSCSYDWIWTLTVTKFFCKLVKSKDFKKSLNYGDFA